MSLLSAIDKAKSISFTDGDIKKICGNKAKIIMYHELETISNILNLFHESNVLIILYETTEQFVGHWVCLLWYPDENLLQFFDPYAMRLDSELKYNKMDKTAYLSYLIKMAQLQQNVRFEQNKFDLQEKVGSVSTCGRWVCLRCLLYKFKNDQFVSLFKKGIKLDDPDDVVTIMTIIFNL